MAGQPQVPTLNAFYRALREAGRPGRRRDPTPAEEASRDLERRRARPVADGRTRQIRMQKARTIGPGLLSL